VQPWRLALLGSVAELTFQEMMRRRLGEHAGPFEHGAPKRLEQLS
jgi:hypothetical protein